MKFNIGDKVSVPEICITRKFLNDLKDDIIDSLTYSTFVKGEWNNMNNFEIAICITKF